MRKIVTTLLVGLFLLSACAPVTATPFRDSVSPSTTLTAPPSAAAPTATKAAKAHRLPLGATPASKNKTKKSAAANNTPSRSRTETPVPSQAAPSQTASSQASPTPAATVAANAQIPASGAGKVPAFDHIALIMLENHSFDTVIGSSKMPNLNALAQQNVLLTQYYAVRHPSLPNYIALVSGDTQGITKDCTNCYIDQPNLADRIEASGRTWKTYQEDMPSPCYEGNAKPYMQKHNPFMYFDNIRNDSARCNRSVTPLQQLDADLASNQVPNFSFIMPNICNSSHDCSRTVADAWIGAMAAKLQAAPAFAKNSLIIITFDEAGSEEQSTNTESCCGLPASAGGRIAAVLISPEAKAAFQDGTPYSHYSLLKTILAAWGLPDLGKTAMPETQPIVAPWK